MLSNDALDILLTTVDSNGTPDDCIALHCGCAPTIKIMLSFQMHIPPTANIAACGVLIIAVKCAMPIIPKLLMLNVIDK
jgi:hypothetical protein